MPLAVRLSDELDAGLFGPEHMYLPHKPEMRRVQARSFAANWATRLLRMGLT